ncbi:MAG: hypothetical protein ACE5MG_10270 [Candidatus Methylomirabilales bacterium]
MIQNLRKKMAFLAAVMLLAAWPVVVGVPVARAQLGSMDFQLWEALITDIDFTHQEVSLWDYRSGRRRSGLTVKGIVGLEEFKVGDYVLARVGVEDDLVNSMRVLPPPEGDAKFEKALRYVLGKEHK